VDRGWLPSGSRRAELRLVGRSLTL
jgi:hypothetical protein